MPSRQSLWSTDITVGGIHLGLADKWDGGESTVTSGVYWRATGKKSLGGVPDRNDGTATYLYDEKLHASFRALNDGNGNLDAIIIRTPLNDDGTPFAGGGFTMTGVLQEVPMPSGDYSSNDGADVALVFQLDGPLA